ncbi:hypothetical protein CEXT_385281, partial [Caerostris extrusa]
MYKLSNNREDIVSTTGQNQTPRTKKHHYFNRLGITVVLNKAYHFKPIQKDFPVYRFYVAVSGIGMRSFGFGINTGEELLYELLYSPLKIFTSPQ